MKISIITATYNRAATLPRTIASVLGQTHEDIDYWIIDGQSQDETVDVIKSFVPKFKGRMNWISEPDKGIYDAMNKGISHCKGDVIGILNSDDWFTSNDILAHVAEAFTEDVDAVFGDVHFIEKGHEHQIMRYQSGRMYRPFMTQLGFVPPHASFYVRREVFERFGAYDTTYQIAGDFDLIARLCYKHKIRTRYMHLDFVTMTHGGASTHDQEALDRGTQEVVDSCKRLGINLTKAKIRMRNYLYAIAQYI